MDNQPLLDLVRWVRFRWQLNPKIAVGDTKYGTAINIAGLEDDGIRAFLPTMNPSRSKKLYSLDRFTYDAERNIYVCPQGQELHCLGRSNTMGHWNYRADSKICNQCPVKSKCTTGKSGRSIARSYYQDYLDKVKTYVGTEAYKKALRKRQVWVEPLFGEGKQWHQMRYFRLRRLKKVNIESLIRAAGQNIKRLLKHKFTPSRPPAQESRATLTVLELFLGINITLMSFE